MSQKIKKESRWKKIKRLVLLLVYPFIIVGAVFEGAEYFGWIKVVSYLLLFFAFSFGLFYYETYMKEEDHE